jgi:hypothetical protein
VARLDRQRQGLLRQLDVRPDAYATGFVTLALARRATLGREPLDEARAE